MVDLGGEPLGGERGEANTLWGRRAWHPGGGAPPPLQSPDLRTAEALHPRPGWPLLERAARREKMAALTTVVVAAAATAVAGAVAGAGAAPGVCFSSCLFYINILDFPTLQACIILWIAG